MISRVFLYLMETFRLPTRILLILATTLVIFLFQEVAFNPAKFVMCCLIVLSGFLHFRISDEFKDEKADKVFFPNRPYPSGRVLKKDLYFLIAFCALIQLLAIISYPSSRIMGAILFTHSFLVHYSFFLPERLKQRRILSLFLEISICFSIYIYLITIMHNGDLLAVFTLKNIGLLLALVLPTFHWEVIRKTFYINKPGYPSYSKELTYAGAILFSLSFFFPLAAGLWLTLDSEIYIPLISSIIVYSTYLWGLGLNEKSPRFEFQTLAELLYLFILTCLIIQGIL